MAGLASINIRFFADLKQFSTQMQTANRKMQKLGKRMQSVGTGLTVGLTAPIVALGVKSVQAFDKQAKAIAQVEAGLKSTEGAAGRTSQELQDMATSLQGSTLFGDDAILKDVTAQLLTFTNIAGEQFDRTQLAALNLATRLDGDLKSASIQLGKALNDPVANLSALSRSGIQFSTEQKGLIKSLVETNKLAEAQTIILNELENQYGGAAEAAAKSGTGAFKQLSNSLGDLTEEFGKIITEAILPFVEKIKTIATNFSKLDNRTKKTIAIIAGLTAVLGPLLIAMGFLMTTVIPGLITAFTALKVAMLSNPYTAIAAAIGLVIGAMLLMGDTAKDLSKQQTILQKVSDDATKSIAKEKAKLSELLFVARDEKTSKEQRLKAIKELNKISPKYLGDLTLDKINTDSARIAIEKYNAELLKTARIKAAQQELQRIESELITLELDAGKKRYEAAQKRKELQERFTNDTQALTNQLGILTGAEKINDLIVKNKNKTLTDERDLLLEIITANLGVATSIEKVNNATTTSRPTATSVGNVPEEGFMNTLSLGSTESIEQSKFYVDAQIAEADRLAAAYERLQAVAESVSIGVSDAFSMLASKVVGSLELADTGFEGFVKGLLGTITRLIAMMLASSISQAISGATASGSATGPAAVVTTPAFIATAVGGVLSAFAAIPKFAQGGVITGETLAIVGDNRNARFDPEIIAPLSKLRDYIGVNNGGNTQVSLGLGAVIKGNDLELVIDRVLTNKLRY